MRYTVPSSVRTFIAVGGNLPLLRKADFTLVVRNESLPREESEELPATCSSLTTLFTLGILQMFSPTAFFSASVDTSPVSSTLPL